jgi:hypothetical protein
LWENLFAKVGQDILLKQVRHVPEMRMSLISMGRLDDEGYSQALEKEAGKLAKEHWSWPKDPRQEHYTH